MSHLTEQAPHCSLAGAKGRKTIFKVPSSSKENPMIPPFPTTITNMRISIQKYSVLKEKICQSNLEKEEWNWRNQPA